MQLIDCYQLENTLVINIVLVERHRPPSQVEITPRWRVLSRKLLEIADIKECGWKINAIHAGDIYRSGWREAQVYHFYFEKEI